MVSFSFCMHIYYKQRGSLRSPPCCTQLEMKPPITYTCIHAHLRDKSTKMCEGQTLRPINHELIVQYSVLCMQHVLIAGTVHARLLHPVCARGQINQLPKKLVSLIAVSLERLVNARCQAQSLLPP